MFLYCNSLMTPFSFVIGDRDNLWSVKEILQSFELNYGLVIILQKVIS